MRLGEDIAERLTQLALGALLLSAQLPRHPAGRHLAQQLVRCSTSAGANYEEARAGESRADFIHKLGIAAKEAREARCWLDLIRRSGWAKTDPAVLIEESRALAAILGASVRTARKSATAAPT